MIEQLLDRFISFNDPSSQLCDVIPDLNLFVDGISNLAAIVVVRTLADFLMDGIKLDVINNCGTIDGFLDGLLTTLVFDVLFVIN